MKKLWLIIWMVIILALLAHPTLAAISNKTSTDRRLNDLSNRFSNLELNWGRFQIGGNIEIDSASFLAQDQNSLSPLSFNQELNLFLDAYIDQNTQLSIKLNQSGNWGGIYSTVNPFQVDEAFLRLSFQDSLDYLGRFRFSLGPLGIASDFFYIPAEGFALQKAFKNFHLIAVYSRPYIEFNEYNQNLINRTYDYLVTRIGWSNQNTIIGLNVVPDINSGEQSVSVDWSSNFIDTKLAAEIAMYSFNSDKSNSWRPGILFSFGKNLNKDNFIQLKAGYLNLSPNYAPYYSSLSRINIDNREWFIPNSQGIELYLQNVLKHGYALENRLIALTPVENSPIDLIYRWRFNLNKNFSPVNQFQIGLDLKAYPTEPSYSYVDVDNRIFANWNIRF